MGVIGTRVSAELGWRVEDYCRGLGKRPSQWMRELMEKELTGKRPSPALGEALQGLTVLMAEHTKLLHSLLAFSVGAYQMVVRSEMLTYPEKAKQIEELRRQFIQGFLPRLPSELLTVELGFRVSDLNSEIERLKEGKEA